MKDQSAVFVATAPNQQGKWTVLVQFMDGSRLDYPWLSQPDMLADAERHRIAMGLPEAQNPDAWPGF